jgi:DNA helicase II / ATP-dependent DNA helicase PcrA
MRQRLSLLDIHGVQMGTFHSICAMFLRKHGRRVGLDTNFTICDADERYVPINHDLIDFEVMKIARRLSLLQSNHTGLRSTS